MKVFDSRKFLGGGAILLFATLAVSGASSMATAIVKDVVVNSSGQSLEVRITATEAAKFTYFELSGPRRLVVDFQGSESNLGVKEIPVRQGGVERVRTSDYRDKDRQATRIVFDLSEAVPYRVVNDGGGLVRVVFGATKAEAAPQTARAPLNPSVGSPAVAPPILPRAPIAATPAPAVAPPIPPRTPIAAATPAPAALPAIPPRAPIAAAPPAPAALPTVAPAVAPRTPLAATPAADPAAQNPPVIITGPAPGQPQFTGEMISLDLKDVDIKDFFRLIGEISGLNIVLDPNVSGTLTILLKDVPWDQALDVVLRNYQLGVQLQGNVLRIATNTALQAEQGATKSLKDAQELSAELLTRTYVLNYTKADVLAATLQKVLSVRGTIIQDVRRNALIISDIPAQFGRVDQMLQFLDTPAQQVEIEARLLSATKSFSRDLGSQLGVLFGANTGNILTGGSGASSPFQRTPAPRATTSGSSLPLATNFPVAASSGLAFLMQPGGDILLDAIITASEARGTAKLISRPRIMTQNNQAATVSRGTQIPVQTNVNNTISTQFLNFALKLSVTPQITEAGTILLTVNIENSEPDFARAVNGVPSVATQQAQTVVIVPDGGTTMIGGILVDTDSLAVRQVPGLGSLPILGHLFKSEQTIKSTSELLFFITPRIKALDSVDVTVPGAGEVLPKED